MISLKRAVEVMGRKDMPLIRENGPRRRWFIPLAGEVSEETAAIIQARPDVAGQKDGMFPGLDQTWRIIK
jgi:hypothetical protein